MASPVTNRRANKYSNLVGQFGRQGGTQPQVVEAPGRSSRREVPHGTIEKGGGAEDQNRKRGKGSAVNSAEGSFTRKPRPIAPRGQQTESIDEVKISNPKNKKRERTPERTKQSVETSQESEPVRQAKRRRTAQAVEEPYIVVSSSPTPPVNKRRKRLLVNNSTTSLISKEPELPLSQKDEIEDSYEASRTFESSPFARVVVEIPVDEDFDRKAYALVSVSSTQSSSTTQLETPYRHPTAQQNPSSSHVGEIVIPDSQEILCDSSTESLRRDAAKGLSPGQADICIPNSSSVERLGAALGASSPALFPQGDRPIELVPSVSQNSGSNSTESWQGAQRVLSLERSTSQISPVELGFEIFQDKIENKGCVSQRGLSQDQSQDSALSHRDANSQGSGSETRRSKVANSGSQNNPHRIEPVPTENATVIEYPENLAADEIFQSPQRPTSPHLNLLSCPDAPGSNLLPRPHTPSDFRMAESAAASANSKMSFAELAMQARDKVKARFEGLPAAPSADVNASSHAPHVPQQMLPVRENITEASPLAPMEENIDDDEKPSDNSEITLGLPPMNPTDHVILMPLASMVRNVYKATITNRKREIMAFLNNEEIDPKVLDQMDSMVEELKMLTDHQDLITDISLTQSNVPDEHQAKWAETCSTKCLFIRYLLENLRKGDMHIAILARSGRMLDILESILKVNGFIYERPDRSSQSNSRAFGPLRITLLPTGLSGGQYVVNRADAVIAFDETFRVAELYSKVLRTHLYEPGKLSPLISLVVAYSAEHLDLCLPTFDDPIERKICLVNIIAQKRDELGDLDEGLPEPQQAAAAAARYLRFDGSSWPLPKIPDITGLKFPDPSHQEQLRSGLVARSQTQEQLTAVTPHGPTKRTLRAESISGPDSETTKRMRMTPTRGEAVSSGEVTRVSDTVGHRTQAPLTSTGNIAYEAPAKVDVFNGEQSRHITSLLEKVDNLEVELQDRQNTEERLRLIVKNLEARLEDYVVTIKKLEPRLLQAIADRGKFQEERDTAKSQAATLTQSIEARVAEIAKLKENKVSLERELAASRADLVNATVPETAQFAQAQEQLRALQVDKEKLEKRILSMQKDFEFTRDSYQKASSYTTELRNELSEMQEQNTILQRKASENTVRVAEIQRTNEAKDREERIDELEALLRDRDQELRKKTEELKIKTNGRRETRGTSVPRSPRMGSGAMSPRPRFAQPAGGSRGGSPAPGDGREGVRDATMFLSSALASARYGHLNDG